MGAELSSLACCEQRQRDGAAVKQAAQRRRLSLAANSSCTRGVTIRTGSGSDVLPGTPTGRRASMEVLQVVLDTSSLSPLSGGSSASKASTASPGTPSGGDKFMMTLSGRRNSMPKSPSSWEDKKNSQKQAVTESSGSENQSSRKDKGESSSSTKRKNSIKRKGSTTNRRGSMTRVPSGDSSVIQLTEWPAPTPDCHRPHEAHLFDKNPSYGK